MPVPEIFKLLPLSLLALRVSKADPHAGHDHGPTPPVKDKKRVKGLWHVKIEQQQDVNDDLHYVWLYEGSQWRQKLYAGGALVIIMAIVMFPLWPVKLRIGVWYLSMGMLGLIGLFFAMAIFRLILFCATVFTVPPGLWLYPNLFEDVGFFDSFRPVWGWQEVSFALFSFSQSYQLFLSLPSYPRFPITHFKKKIDQKEKIKEILVNKTLHLHQKGRQPNHQHRSSHNSCPIIYNSRGRHKRKRSCTAETGLDA